MAQQPVELSRLQQAIRQGQSLQQGQSGQLVMELQKLLNQLGEVPPLLIDGQLGPRTRQAVCRYQDKARLQADGIVGPETLRALLTDSGLGVQQHPAEKPATESPVTASGPGRANRDFAPTASERERQAEAILRENGQWPPEDGRLYAIQIDQDSPTASASQSERAHFLRSYSGQTAVFRAEQGRLYEQHEPLRSASHPGQFATKNAGTTDVDGDGNGDIAWIRPGVYYYSLIATPAGRFSPTRSTQFQNVARDANQDGVISGAEQQGRHQALGIQIHAGGEEGPSSIGCQTMPPAIFEQFRRTILAARRGSHSDFTYILVRRPNEKFGCNPF